MTRPRPRWLLPLMLALTACAARGADASIEMSGHPRFEPATVDVPLGGTVVWHNDGVTRHTVTAVGEDREPTGAFDSGIVEGTGTYSHTFERPGSYRYMCTVHGGNMVGVVTVAES